MSHPPAFIQGGRGQKLPTVIFDLDSTLANTLHRHDDIPNEENGRTWWDYAERCHEDTPIEGAVRLARMLAGSHLIIVLSARPASTMDATRLWLGEHEIPHDKLILCPHEVVMGDGGHDRLIRWKMDRVAELMSRGHTITLALDDSFAAEEAFASFGIPTVTVLAPGVRRALSVDAELAIHGQGV